MDIDLSKIKKVHFIGIGGIGVSAVARMMLHEGKQVSGSDRSSSEITEMLEALGVKVGYPQKTENISAGTDLIVYTVAVTEENPELMQAKKMSIKTLTYPEFLGALSKGKYTICCFRYPWQNHHHQPGGQAARVLGTRSAAPRAVFRVSLGPRARQPRAIVHLPGRGRTS